MKELTILYKNLDIQKKVIYCDNWFVDTNARIIFANIKNEKIAVINIDEILQAFEMLENKQNK